MRRAWGLLALVGLVVVGCGQEDVAPAPDIEGRVQARVAASLRTASPIPTPAVPTPDLKATAAARIAATAVAVPTPSRTFTPTPTATRTLTPTPSPTPTPTATLSSHGSEVRRMPTPKPRMQSPSATPTSATWLRRCDGLPRYGLDGRRGVAPSVQHGGRGREPGYSNCLGSRQADLGRCWVGSHRSGRHDIDDRQQLPHRCSALPSSPCPPRTAWS